MEKNLRVYTSVHQEISYDSEAVSTGGAKEAKETIISADDDNAADLIGEDFYENLMEEIELLDGAAADLDMEKEHQGKNYPQYSLISTYKLLCRNHS